MLTKNLPDLQFTEAEKTALRNYLNSIEEILKPKMVQLSSDESHQYGRLGFNTEQWATKMRQDVVNMPTLAPSFVDQQKWSENEENFKFLNALTNRLKNLGQQVADSNKVIGFDIYHVCLSVYKNVKYLSTQDVAGFKSYYDAWSIFFASRNTGKKNKTPVVESSNEL
jgi:hypothetical protein